MKVKNKEEVEKALEECIIYLNKRIGKKPKKKVKKSKQDLQKAS